MVKFRFKSIRTRTIVTILPMLILSMSALSALSYSYSKNIINAEIQDKMAYQLNATINNMQTILTAHSKIPESLARTIEPVGDKIDKGKYFQIIQGLLSTNPDTFGVGIWYEPYQYKNYLQYYSSYAYRDNGRILFSNDYDTKEYNYPEKEWYLLGKNTKETMVWTDPFFDKTSNAMILTTAVPFYTNNKFQGVVTANINLTSLQQKISDIHVGKNGWAFLLDRNGNFIANKDNQSVANHQIKNDSNVSLAQIGQEILANNNGNAVFSDDRGLNIVYYQTVPDTSWKLAIVISQEELYQKLNDYFIISVMIIIVLICIVVMVIYFYSLYITNNIKKVNILAQSMSSGDLTQTIPIKTVDEFGQMGTNLNTMACNLKSILLQVSESAKSVSETSVLLSDNAEQSAKATEEIAQSIQEVAGGTHTQLSLTDEAVEETKVMFVNIKKITQRIELAGQSAKEALQTSIEGKADIVEAINQINLISQNSLDSVGIVRQLEDKSRKINQIMTLLSTIAKQTKMLALNAGIIAAEAGSNGKTFSVISREIRLLAENSTKSNSEIETLITEIQEDISQVVKAMEHADSSIQEGKLLTTKAGDSFSTILNLVDGVSGQAGEMTNDIIMIRMNMQKMVENMEVVSNLYGSSASSTNHISATTEEQTAAIQEVASYSNELAHMAKVLQQSVASFKLK
ncbi:Methyl-accepting chemotaxis protein McpB [Paenibacillus allorhizoplanae]|uniref:Methyl-accepting chemotaxis protein McpB n=1 Tax=Paenibacillus allorhizoplanae TaxID=2905648 RepID=A0ABM9CNX8_9BACL|nr:methyl-accepting chemotaxis protein [Paenibacillus allorhizoplanae]CAH1217548.1 Methyl-accepting chemotaxis protein McpB [Paenibacillus allorhizoplanae]